MTHIWQLIAPIAGLPHPQNPGPRRNMDDAISYRRWLQDCAPSGVRIVFPAEYLSQFLREDDPAQRALGIEMSCYFAEKIATAALVDLPDYYHGQMSPGMLAEARRGFWEKGKLCGYIPPRNHPLTTEILRQTLADFLSRVEGESDE